MEHFLETWGYLAVFVLSFISSMGLPVGAEVAIIYGGVLASGADHRATAQVTAAVLLYRAVTFLPPIPLGAAAFLTWRHAPALIHPGPVSAGPASLRGREQRPEPAPGTPLP